MKYIFVTGMGRSGPKFFANLLSYIKNARVERKFIGVRRFCPSSSYLNGIDYTIPYL